MKRRMRSPGSRAGEAGARPEDHHKDLDTILEDPAAVQLSKTAKAAFCFAFLDRLKRDPEIKPIDILSALWIIGFIGDDLKFFMSARHLAGLIRRVESVAEASLSRLRRGGYLIHVLGEDADQEDHRSGSKPKGGRYANTYRLCIPAEVSPEKSGETDQVVFPEKSGETAAPLEEVSPGKSGTVSPGKSGTITLDDPLEGAGALAARTASLPTGNVVLVEEVAGERTTEEEPDVGARERAPVSPVASSPKSAAEPEGDEDGGDAFGDAVTELHNLHGEAIGDAEGYAYDLIDGFLDGERAAAQRAARRAAALFLDAPSEARAMWAAHRRIAHMLSLDASGSAGRAEAALTHFHAAVAAAGEALKAERRAQLLEDEADDGEGYGF